MLERCEHTRPGAIAGALLSACLLLAAPMDAQPVRGLGDDALTPRRGAVRIQLSTTITDFSQRYGKNTPGRSDGSLEPLGVDFSVDTLGVSVFPGLSPVQNALRTLTGNNDFTLSLGRSAVTSSVRTQTTPILIEAGISNRISLGVLVPMVSARHLVSLNVNPLGVGGNVSYNPARSGSGVETAAAVNTTLVTELTQARDQLAALLASCTANPGSSPSCPGVIANAPGINSSATAFASAITQVYGTTATRESAAQFVPFTGSAADSAIRNRVTTFRTQFEQYGITAINAGTTGPSSATAALSPAGLQRAITDSAVLGLQASQLGTITRQGIGDIELSLKLRLFDSFGFANDTNRFQPKGSGFRQSFAGAVRLGTGTIDSPSDYLDVGTGSGQTDVEFRSFTDIVHNRRFFTSVVARYTMQLPDQQSLRITDTPEQAFAPKWRERLVDRNLGDVMEVELTPRWIISDFLSFGAQYLFRRKAEDTYTGTFEVPPAESGLPTAVTLDANTLALETSGTEQRLGWGITFSSVASHARGKAKLPLELQYFNSRSITGSGGNVPKLSIHQVQVRLYPKR
ncbi:MAG: hypothetical protein V4813_02715 [Gemmatimonadota bacterium]